MTKGPNGKGVTVWLPIDLFEEISDGAKKANRSFSSELVFQARKGIGLPLEPEVKILYGPRAGEVVVTDSAVQSAPVLWDYVEGSLDEMIRMEKISHYTAIPTEALPRKDELDYELAALMVRGEEMNGPAIHNGDLVFFGLKIRQGDGLYVLRVNNDLLVRRLRFNHIERKVHIFYDNPIYDQRTDFPLESSDGEGKDVEIIGKVFGRVERI